MSVREQQLKLRKQVLAAVEHLEVTACERYDNDYPSLSGYYKGVLWSILNTITCECIGSENSDSLPRLDNALVLETIERHSRASEVSSK